jgi:hypothetical protein
MGVASKPGKEICITIIILTTYVQVTFQMENQSLICSQKKRQSSSFGSIPAAPKIQS